MCGGERGAGERGLSHPPENLASAAFVLAFLSAVAYNVGMSVTYHYYYFPNRHAAKGMYLTAEQYRNWTELAAAASDAWLAGHEGELVIKLDWPAYATADEGVTFCDDDIPY